MNNFGFPPFTLPPRSSNGSPQHVVVLGAGTAGLCAAYALEQAGNTVTILEASDRVGGRVLTLREGFTPGVHADAGAAFIPGYHTLTVGYSLAFGLTLVPLNVSGISLDFLRGKVIADGESANADWPVELNEFERGTTPMEWLHKYITEPLNAVLATAPRSATWPPPALAAIDDKSYAELLASNGASDGAIAILRLGFSDLWGDGVDAASALLLLRDDAFSLAGEPPTSPTSSAPTHPAKRRFRVASSATTQGSSAAPAVPPPAQPNVALANASALNTFGVYRIDGGTDGLPNEFAKRLQSSIRFNAPVVRMEQSAIGVAVYVQGIAEPIRGDRVICTLPFSTLRDVVVDPPFSPAKTQAIRELPYTSVTRVFLEFTTRYWLAGGFSGVASTDLPETGDTNIPGFWVEDATIGQDTTRGILDCYINGESARRLTSMSEAERIEAALDVVERLYPGARANYSGNAMTKCWDEAPWQKGDYCWFRPGQMATFCPVISLPEGRIHFAGEHASALPGWIQGALESGLRAATETGDGRLETGG